ncbi:methyltransferase [Actinomadura parmotrematis]|uniref:Class I SAM-dependent methyltransferase n=1 Tax=Actinomadura parmotrematis TaxID=2864039 RepID=A0ABS7G3A4_9ACTN|nr:class I SAM-dependent methyltransferase [Actinomadura parmotrematis]MBW8487021.1 class I SAM-dependent methyltransferase [Actinomadura parmotrematis]
MEPLLNRALLEWDEDGARRSARWRSDGRTGAPRRVTVVDDSLKADTAFRLASEGTALLWRGDYQNARALLQAMARRVDRPKRRPKQAPEGAQAFHLYRQARAQRARLLGMLLIPVDAGHVVALRRAPDVREACVRAFGPADEPYVTSLRDLLGAIGANEWREKGVPVPALGGDRIHPHYGVFSPVRGEYVDLVAEAPLPPAATAFDIGTGTGVLAAVLARRGVPEVVATDVDPRALACAEENAARLKVADRVRIERADLFPAGRAGLVVCNPPWLPGKAATSLEGAVYDPDSRMLRGFLDGLAGRLESGGEGWLVISDLAELLGLRAPGELTGRFGAAGLCVLGRLDARPRHPKAVDAGDALHAARAAEVTTLWRLGAVSDAPRG